MWQWISSNYHFLSLLANFGMLIVWIAYLQLFMGTLHRQRRSKILINRGRGKTLDAQCIISNMSAQAVYIDSVIMTIESPDASWTSPVTELEGLEHKDTLADQKMNTRQGTMGAGEAAAIGTFRSLIEHVLGKSERRGDETRPDLGKLVAFEIVIVAIYGSEDLPVGAKRTFDIVREQDAVYTSGRTLAAKQIRSRRERRSLNAMLEKHQ